MNTDKSSRTREPRPPRSDTPGNWTDPDTKLVYLRARDYDPAALQFLSVDPAVRQTAQPYAYANNSPLQHADPSGLCIGMDGTPQDRVCTANDYFWSADSQSRMWGDIGAGIGNNFANMAFGIGDAATYNPGLAVFGASSWTELWRNAWIDDCAVPTNGFYYVGSIWAGAAVGAGAAGGAKAIVREVLPTPQVGSPKLQSIVDKLYKGTTNPNRKGNGTTMDAIRSESATGLPTGGKMHTIKGQESRQGLLNWLRRNPDADYHDRLVAQSLADELADVLGIPR